MASLASGIYEAVSGYADASNVRKRSRSKFRAARAFYITLFLGTCFATYSLFSHDFFEAHRPDVNIHLLTRELDSLNPIKSLGEDEKCRLVRRAKDQCAFIRENCPDDEAGFTAYLELFYCQLPHAKPVAFVILITWLGFLFSTIGIAASDFFCIDLSTMATILGMSESMAGVTFLAFGNGSPDVFSTFAAMNSNSGTLALGELFGAAGFITAVVSGSMALIKPFQVAKKSFVRDVGFFTVASAFSMVFLLDGKLHFWECLVMVGFYIFYVAFVVAWHWWLGRRRRRRETEAAARGHFILPEDEITYEEENHYRDGADDAGSAERPVTSRTVSVDEWCALEQESLDPHGNEADEEEEEARDRWMSELASNMRLTKPLPRTRRNTGVPVRPSLVGALEFQAVLKSLQKSRNIQTIPLNERRFSDDPTFTTAQQQDQMSAISDPASRPPYQIIVDEDDSPRVEGSASQMLRPEHTRRSRAVSAGDAEALRIDSDLRYQPPSDEEDLMEVVGEDNVDGPSEEASVATDGINGNDSRVPSLQVVSASPMPGAPTHTPLQSPSQSPLTTPSQQRNGLLAPPGSSDHSRTGSPRTSPRLVREVALSVPRIDTLPDPAQATAQPSPGVNSGSGRSPLVAANRSPLNTRPPSLYLPEPLSLSRSLPESQVGADGPTSSHPLKWWPYALLPSPTIIGAALFPTVSNWKDKTWWERSLGVVAAPSVFFLTITLPVVENERDTDSDTHTPATKVSYDHSVGKVSSDIPKYSDDASMPNLELGLEDDEGSHRQSHVQHHRSFVPTGVTGLPNSATAAITTEQRHHNYGTNATCSSPLALGPVQGASDIPSPSAQLNSLSTPKPEGWNRWLTIIQLYLAPVTIVLSIFIQGASSAPSPRWLLKPILISLLISTVLLIPFLLTTTRTYRPPFYRILLSLAGFIVSIAWISTIAAQVVSALKALAVILNMSDAIMGLTIFAVGNSLGDFVADVTVANLGYPVMALSACFGGPMLNILLGIGLSGSSILLRGAEKRQHKHPEKGIKFHTYHIEVSKTLIVSGATLLLTLVGLLIAVPLNKWTMSRRIGIVFIVVWVLSTIANVVIEVTGWADGLDTVLSLES